MSHARDAVVLHLERHADARSDPTLGDEFREFSMDGLRSLAGGEPLRAAVDPLLE